MNRQLCLDYLERLLKTLLVHLMITNYTVSIKYCKHLDCFMDIDVDHEYLEAHIRFGKLIVKSFTRGDYAFVKATLLHELTHILTSRLTEMKGMSKRKRTETEESVNEHISKIILQSLWTSNLKCV